MPLLRRSLLGAIAAAACLAVSATPSMAVVGGRDASPGEYPAVTEVNPGTPQSAA